MPEKAYVYLCTILRACSRPQWERMVFYMQNVDPERHVGCSGNAPAQRRGQLSREIDVRELINGKEHLVKPISINGSQRDSK